MYTGIRGTTRTFFGRPYRAPTPTLNTSITFNNKITTTPKHIANCSPNNSQKLSNTQHTRQTNPLPEQHIKYKDITSHSPQLNSKRHQNKVKITTHKVLTNQTSDT